MARRARLALPSQSHNARLVSWLRRVTIRPNNHRHLPETLRHFRNSLRRCNYSIDEQ
nr:MAG TPA: hypothetical protein [Caudoviricetes sp.]